MCQRGWLFKRYLQCVFCLRWYDEGYGEKCRKKFSSMKEVTSKQFLLQSI